MAGAASASRRVYLGQHRLIRRGQRPRLRHVPAEVALEEGQHAVRGVAIGRHQLVVVAPHQTRRR